MWQPTAKAAVRTGLIPALALAIGLLVSPPTEAQPGTATTPLRTARMLPVAASTTCAVSRPRNGTILYSRIRGGPGRLTVKNGLRHDGVVVLMRGRSKAVSVYVRAHSNATIPHVKSGTYTIYFTTGSRYRTCRGRFSRNAAYSRFSKRLRFASSPYYTVATATLHGVRNGNTPVSRIKPREYPA